MPSIVWKGQLTFGLVSIPVKPYRAARRERVRMHYVHRPEVPEEPHDEPQVSPPEVPTRFAAPAPQRTEALPPRMEAQRESPPEPPGPVTRVHQALVTPEERPISRADVLRGYEVEPDRYVAFDPEELKDLRRKTSTTMEIVRSVKLAEIDPVFFGTSYYVVPDRGGEKPYAILFRALQEMGHVAVARVGMYGREHVVIVRPGKHGMLAHTMFYVDEIRSENEFRTDVAAVGVKELELAKTFLEALEAPFSLGSPGSAVLSGGIQGRVPGAIGGDDCEESRAGGDSARQRTSTRGEAGRGHHGSSAQEPGNDTEAARKRASRSAAGCRLLTAPM
jgi:non-homologous end joining protein Ku